MDPLLLEAMFEVDDMLPGTTPITPAREREARERRMQRAKELMAYNEACATRQAYVQFIVQKMARKFENR